MKASAKIHVEIREREGSFYATSEQVPGFLLCAKDVCSIESDILPAMKLLLSVKEDHRNRKSPRKDGKRSDQLVARRELAFA